MSNFGNYPFYLSVAKRDFTDHRYLTVIGYNGDVNNATEDAISTGGNINYPAAAGIQMQIVSTSVNDTAAGTGIRQVELHYLDANLNELDEIIILNGVTPVNTVATNIRRVLGIHGIAVGTNSVASGIIKLTDITGVTTYCQIEAGINTHRFGMFTIPLGWTGYILGWHPGSGSDSSTHYTNFLLRATAHDDEGTIEWLDGVFHIWSQSGSQDNETNIIFPVPLQMPAGTDIKISAISDNVTSRVKCTVEIYLLLIQN